MNKSNAFLRRHFEKILALLLGLIIVLVNFVVVQKGTFLNLFYLPILVTGYFLGKRQAVMAAMVVVGLVVFATLQNPGTYFSGGVQWLMWSEITTWSGLLILAAYLTGLLSEQRELKIRELTTAYIGIVEILTKYFLESSDRYTKGHSIRVADYSTQVGIKLGLADPQIENLRVAALLHDISKVRLGTDLVQKASSVAIEEKEVAYSSSVEGSRFLNALGGVLNNAMPLVTKYHNLVLGRERLKTVGGIEIPLEVKIIAACDAFDSMMMGNEYKTGVESDEAFRELTKTKQVWSDERINQALREVLNQKLYTGKDTLKVPQPAEPLPAGITGEVSHADIKPGLNPSR
ncbi:MAG: HD domain-containing protein [candidate division Zixibacteria bacterium]|nr:HD domain-containing protein [candidate division Zixibacteria bacterium]